VHQLHSTDGAERIAERLHEVAGAGGRRIHAAHQVGRVRLPRVVHDADRHAGLRALPQRLCHRLTQSIAESKVIGGDVQAVLRATNELGQPSSHVGAGLLTFRQKRHLDIV
jgi:hypothetical protein